MPTTNPTERNPTERAPIEALFNGLITAWTRGDADAYGRLFSDDADYVAFDGSHQHGRRAIAESHRALFGGPLRGSRMEGAITDLKFIAPDVAVLHAEGNTAFSWQKGFDPKRRSIQTFVARREGGAWQFVAFHNTRIRPITAFQQRLFGLLLKLRSNR
jgi:uncharacterized protein (TIGR02246 family)